MLRQLVDILDRHTDDLKSPQTSRYPVPVAVISAKHPGQRPKGHGKPMQKSGLLNFIRQAGHGRHDGTRGNRQHFLFAFAIPGRQFDAPKAHSWQFARYRPDVVQ